MIGRRVISVSASQRWFACRFRSTDANENRISRTLYRQFLRWCQEVDPRVPLSTFVPPIKMDAPQSIDAYRTELLVSNSDLSIEPEVDRISRTMLPERSVLSSNRIIVPIENSVSLKNFFRLIFRINNEMPSEENYQKQRISAAFEGLRSLNDLRQSIHEAMESRKSHTDRAGVKFCVGDVVQHREERWRGVIMGWEREEPNDHLTSLTTKEYSNEKDIIRYDVILDAGDGFTFRASGDWTKVLQSEVDIVADSALARIRSGAEGVDAHFDAFDPVACCFKPNELLQFTYPSDSSNREVVGVIDRDPIYGNVISGVRDVALRLERCILDESSNPRANGWTLLANVQERLGMIIKDDQMIPISQRLRPGGLSPSKQSALFLRELHNIFVEIFDVVFQRKLSKETKEKLKFSIGDIVHHKKFGFRGVIVAFDGTPRVDVTRWDGLQDIKDPMNVPFYHVIPDQGDCIRAFGGERDLRYVCEENLETCPENQKNIDIDLDGDWKLDSIRGSYVAPPDVAFKYGENLDDGGATERCMNRIQDEINSWQLLALTGGSKDAIAQKLSKETLHQVLQKASTLGDAMPVGEMLKEMRKANTRKDLRRRLELGIASLMRGKTQDALDIFLEVIRQDPSYAEGWNKVATCQFMLGNLEESLASTRKVLEYDPLHFQAWNGLGLIHFEKEEYDEAISSFRESLRLDPWSPISSKLSISLDLQKKKDGETVKSIE